MNKIPIVLTMYGTGEVINNITVTLLEDINNWGMESSVQDYCNNINELELKDDKWIYATKIEENKKIKLGKPIKLIDFGILCSLDDYAIQKIIRETASNVLAQALKSADKNMLVAVLRNMSKRASKMLIEEMKYIPVISHEDIQNARRKIANLIQHLEMTGQIVVPKFNQNEN